MLRLAERLAQKPKSFEELALKHSECPTAMRGGRIGLVRRGRLYPELDEAAFALHTGQISEVVESEMGFHLLWCKTIRRPETISLKKAAPHIRKILKERLKENRMRAWIADLTQGVRSGLPAFASSSAGSE
jgi:parvulin-like peptidyl-prolyl isomerase